MPLASWQIQGSQGNPTMWCRWSRSQPLRESCASSWKRLTGEEVNMTTSSSRARHARGHTRSGRPWPTFMWCWGTPLKRDWCACSWSAVRARRSLRWWRACAARFVKPCGPLVLNRKCRLIDLQGLGKRCWLTPSSSGTSKGSDSMWPTSLTASRSSTRAMWASRWEQRSLLIYFSTSGAGFLVPPRCFRRMVARSLKMWSIACHVCWTSGMRWCPQGPSGDKDRWNDTVQWSSWWWCAWSSPTRWQALKIWSWWRPAASMPRTVCATARASLPFRRWQAATQWCPPPSWISSAVD